MITRDFGLTRSTSALHRESDRFESRLTPHHNIDVKMVPTAAMSGSQL